MADTGALRPVKVGWSPVLDSFHQRGGLGECNMETRLRGVQLGESSSAKDTSFSGTDRIRRMPEGNGERVVKSDSQ